MKHEVLKHLMSLIERKYGTLDDPRGAYLNGSWLSVEAIVELINQADEECSDSRNDEPDADEADAGQGDEIDLAQTARAIVEALEHCGFNDCTDASGYYTIREFGDDLERCVDVYKSNGDGTERAHYVVYCSYEDDNVDFAYTEDLSVEALEKVLRELAA